ncbi:hypothetical protein [Engelhardtia mirabilis]
MRVFLVEKPESEEEIEQMLRFEPSFIPLPEKGRRRMLWMPDVVWRAHDYASERGVCSRSISDTALREAALNGLPLELVYPRVVYRIAEMVRENEERAKSGGEST